VEEVHYRETRTVEGGFLKRLYVSLTPLREACETLGQEEVAFSKKLETWKGEWQIRKLMADCN